MNLSAVAAGGQIRGDREDQEDRFAVVELAPSSGGAVLLVVADGMGGHAAGALAAETALNAFVAAMRSGASAGRDGLRPALMAANEGIHAVAREKPELDGMGCTLVSGLVADGALSWISVGDSALFLLRDGTLRRVNADHSMRAILREMADAGKISHEDAENDPHRSALRSALTGDGLDLIDDPGTMLPLKAGDKVIAVSDGMETLSADEMARIAAQPSSPQSTIERLLKAVAERNRPGQDNATVAIYCHPAGQALPPARRRRGAAIAAALLALVLIGSAAGYFLFMPRHDAKTAHAHAAAPAPAQVLKLKPKSPPRGKP